MPAKKLTTEQAADAARVRAAFGLWQERQKAAMRPFSQEDAAAELGFGQSALNQYLGGRIPLNIRTVLKFSKLLGESPEKLCPNVVQAARQAAQEISEALGGAKVIALSGREGRETAGLRLGRGKKHERSKRERE